MVSPGNLTKQALLKAALAFNQVFEAYEGSLCSYGVTSINSRKKRPWKSLFCALYLRGFFLAKSGWECPCVVVITGLVIKWLCEVKLFSLNGLGNVQLVSGLGSFFIFLWEIIRISWIYENKMAKHSFAKISCVIHPVATEGKGNLKCRWEWGLMQK